VTKNPCTICGEPRLVGVELCMYHWNEWNWGKDWADKVRAGEPAGPAPTGPRYGMKMQAGDFENLRAAINAARSASEYSLDDYTVAGLSEARYGWDLLWASKFDIRPLYNYLSDRHIETALRRIVMEPV